MSSIRHSHYSSAPIDGVSQAAPQVALNGTCRDARNIWPILPQGVGPRPPFTWAKQLFTAADPNALIVEIPRGSPSEDLTLIINEEGGSYVPRLYLSQDLSTVALTIDSDAQDYLDASLANGPNRDLVTATIEDTTFIANRNVVVADSGDTTPARPFEALIWVKAAGYGRTTTVTVTPFTGSPVTAWIALPDGLSGGQAQAATTDFMAQSLYTGISGAAHGATESTTHLDDLTGAGYTVTLDGPVIYISHPSNDFTLSVADGAGGTAVAGIKGSVQRFSDLPAAAHDGFTIRVSQSLTSASGDADYFVAFSATNTTTSGIWEEVIEPGADLGLDPLTLPMGIVYDGGWQLRPLDWAQRAVGNATLNPSPGFLGDTLQGVSWAGGRLALLSTGGLRLSSTDDPFNFYRSTLATTLDSDPIGLLPPASSKVFFKDLIDFNGDLVLFADGFQARLSVPDTGITLGGGSRLVPFANSPYTSSIPLQAFATSRVHYLAGQADEDSSWMDAYELSIDRVSGLVDPQPLSAALPAFLPNTLDRAATWKKGFISLFGSSGLTELFLHVGRRAANETVQNAWVTWDLPSGYTLMGLVIRGSVLRAFVRSTGTTYCHAIELRLAPGAYDQGSPKKLTTHLDMRISEDLFTSIAYDAPSDTTTITMPFPLLGTELVCVRAPGHLPEAPEGLTLIPTSYATSSLVLDGDWEDMTLWVGQAYAPSTYLRFHTLFALDTNGQPKLDGRFNLAKVTFDVNSLSSCRVKVEHLGRDDRFTDYEGLFTDNPETPLDEPSLSETAAIPVGIAAKNSQCSITMYALGVHGFQLIGYEWEGNYDARTFRI